MRSRRLATLVVALAALWSQVALAQGGPQSGDRARWDAAMDAAEAAIQAGRWRDAEAPLRNALEIAERQFGETDERTAMVIGFLGMSLQNQGRYADAEPLLKRELDLKRRVYGDQHQYTAASYNLLGMNLVGQGRYADALPMHERALQIRLQALGENHVAVAASYGNVADTLYQLGRYAEAEPRSAKALEIARRTVGEDTPLTANLYGGAGMIAQAQGRYAEAATDFERSLAIRRRTLGDDHQDTALAYGNLASNRLAMGRASEATPLYLQSLEILRRAVGENHPLTATAYANLATSLRGEGRRAEAMPLAAKALDIRRQVLGEDHLYTAQSYHDYALDLYDQGRYDDAAIAFAQSMDILERTVGYDHPVTQQVMLDFAVCLDDLGSHAKAAPLLARVVDARRRQLGEAHPDTLQAKFWAAWNLGLQGKHAEAAAAYAPVLAQRRQKLGDLHPETAGTFEALAYEQLQLPGQAAAAVANMRAAVAAARSRQGSANRATDDESRQLREAQRARGHYRLLADALWSGDRDSNPAATDNEAFMALQDAIASSASQAVAQMGARFSGGNDDLRHLARDRQDIAAQLSMADQQLVAALAAVDSGAAARADAQRAAGGQLRARLVAIDAELKQRFPAYFELVSPEPMPIAAVQAQLRDDEALLLVVPGEFGTHVFAVSHKQTAWVRSPWWDDTVDWAVTGLRCDVDRSRCRDTPAAAPTRGAQRSDVPPRRAGGGGFDRRLAYQLYQQVVAPAMPVLSSAKTVYVVTTGSLSSLPFSVLVTKPPQEGEDDNDPGVLRRTPWLLREFALVTLPSVTSLKALRAFEAAAQGGTGGYEFVGFGDPVLGAGTTAAAGRGPTRAAALFKGVAANGAGLADPQALRVAFAPLPGTKVELEAMQQAFAPRAQIRLGPQATEAAVKGAPLEGVKVVAFSTHGLVAGEMEGLAEPGLVFTPPATASAEDDGLLTASEVAQLKLSADWVILSACNTAASDGTPGADALSGLARSFFYAGAKSLLVSHWPVRDDVASLMTVDAIRRQRSTPSLGRAEALREATLAILDGSATGPAAWAQPSAWAPFSLVGEGR